MSRRTYQTDYVHVMSERYEHLGSIVLRGIIIRVSLLYALNIYLVVQLTSRATTLPNQY